MLFSHQSEPTLQPSKPNKRQATGAGGPDCTRGVTCHDII
jgi:hypothetical protein